MVNVSKEVAEENRQELAISADVLSRRHGLDRVSVVEIAKHANLTTGAVYTHYGSRERLLAAGIRAGFDRMVAWLETLESGQEYQDQARANVRLRDGSLWCPAMSHIGSIRTASTAEQAEFAEGLNRMLAKMTRWHDVGSTERALEIIAGITGDVLFAGRPTARQD